MKIVIYTDSKGFPAVSVEGEVTDKPKEIVKVYKSIKKELNKEDR